MFTCSFCQQGVCSFCEKAWHEETCQRPTEIEWDMLGDGAGKANRCPKCKSPFEKVSGCSHMTCAVCAHHWCWTCGLDYYSPLHMMQLGGILCEFIGLISFANLSACTKALLMVVFVVLFPVVILFLCLCIGGAVATLLIQGLKCCPGLTRFYDNSMRSLTSCNESGGKLCRAITIIPVLIAKFLVLLALLTFGLSIAVVWTIITCGIGTLLFGIGIVPAYLMLFFLLCRKFYIWSKFRQQRVNPEALVQANI
jgi:hypothetical protein